MAPKFSWKSRKFLPLICLTEQLASLNSEIFLGISVSPFAGKQCGYALKQLCSPTIFSYGFSIDVFCFHKLYIPNPNKFSSQSAQQNLKTVTIWSGFCSKTVLRQREKIVPNNLLLSKQNILFTLGTFAAVLNFKFTLYCRSCFCSNKKNLNKQFRLTIERIY